MCADRLADYAAPFWGQLAEARHEVRAAMEDLSGIERPELEVGVGRGAWAGLEANKALLARMANLHALPVVCFSAYHGVGWRLNCEWSGSPSAGGQRDAGGCRGCHRFRHRCACCPRPVAAAGGWQRRQAAMTFS